MYTISYDEQIKDAIQNAAKVLFVAENDKFKVQVLQTDSHLYVIENAKTNDDDDRDIEQHLDENDAKKSVLSRLSDLANYDDADDQVQADSSFKFTIIDDNFIDNDEVNEAVKI